MLHLGNKQLNAAFRSSRRAFHLETSDDYAAGSPEESEGVQRFLRGEAEDDSWAHPWFALMKEVTDAGTLVQRVRVVSVPHTDYIRYAVATTGPNIAAGEDIRWLPRHHPGADLPTDDWWLFDDDLVAYTVFTSDGGMLDGWVATTDPVIIGHCATVRDRLWPKAIPHHDYAK